MNISIVNSIRVCGGGEKWLVRQASCWKDRGFAPRIICQPGSGLEKITREADLSCGTVRMPHDVSPTAIAALAGDFRRHRPQLVLCCNERAFRLAMPATWIAGGIPLVYRNGLTATFKNRLINRLLFAFARQMVVISEPLREEMASYGWIEPSRLRIIRNGIDTQLYLDDPAARRRVRESMGVAPDTVVAAVLARVTEDKGQVETIEALAGLLKDPRFHQFRTELWIVGEGSLRPRLEDLARDLNVAAHVRFTGFRSDIPSVLQAVDIVVQASHREGLGNTLLEAMAAGRPIVASAVGGILDVVIPGETGELVPPYNAAALAASLGPLILDRDLRSRYGANGRRRAEVEFRLDRETREWCQLFGALTNGGLPLPQEAPGPATPSSQ